MPVAFTSGDLFGSECDAFVNTVNCAGAMGKGIALEFKRRFPDMYDDYVSRCARNEVLIGRPYLYRDTLIPPWIVNFPTKRHWRGRSRLPDIERGLAHLAEQLPEWEIHSLAVPPLGCGNGGLRWQDVKPLIARYMDPLDARVEVFAPQGY